MTKDRLITVKVEPEFWDRLKAKSAETGIPYAVVVRRALEAWVVTGEVTPAQLQAAQPVSRKATKPQPAKTTGGKRSAAKPKA